MKFQEADMQEMINKFIRGSAEIERMKSEIRTFIPVFMQLYLASLVNAKKVRFHLKEIPTGGGLGNWNVSGLPYASQWHLTLRNSEGNTLIDYFHKDVDRDPCMRLNVLNTQSVYESLEMLVDGMLKAHPDAITFMDPLLKAADYSAQNQTPSP
jgi:hypothetical protein